MTFASPAVALERLLAQSNAPRITVNAASGYGLRLVENNLAILPKSERERVSMDVMNEADVFMYVYGNPAGFVRSPAHISSTSPGPRKMSAV